MSYLRKAIIEALQYDGTNAAAMLTFLRSGATSEEPEAGLLLLVGISGQYSLNTGDYLVLESGSFTAMTEAAFQALYQTA